MQSKILASFVLGALGILGWYLIKGGFLDRGHWSPYQMLFRLIGAFLIFSYCLRPILKIVFGRKRLSRPNLRELKILAAILHSLIGVQIIGGALVVSLGTRTITSLHWSIGILGLGTSVALFLKSKVLPLERIHRFLVHSVCFFVVAQVALGLFTLFMNASPFIMAHHLGALAAFGSLQVLSYSLDHST